MQSKQTLIKLKLDKAGVPTLSERRESLSIKLFEDIVSNEHHKLANQLIWPVPTLSVGEIRGVLILHFVAPIVSWTLFLLAPNK